MNLNEIIKARMDYRQNNPVDCVRLLEMRAELIDILIDVNTLMTQSSDKSGKE